MRVTFFGSDSFVLPVLKALEDNFEVVGVVTTAGSPISKHFQGPILTPDKLDDNFKFKILNLKLDLGVVASYGKIIPEDILNIPQYGFLNVHPSLLPKFRGASPVPATILSREKLSGVTIIKMDAKMDHGPIIYTNKISLSGKEDTPTLITKLFQEGAEELVGIIPDYIEGKVNLKEQNHEKATFCKMMKKEDGFFEIDSPPSLEILGRMIRAFHPWPGVWTRWKGKIVKLLPNIRHSVLDTESKNIDSRIRGNDTFLIQIEGKKIMPLPEFLKGYPDFPLREL